MRPRNEITFDNGNRASVVMADVDSHPATLLAELGLTGRCGQPVAVVLGAADSLTATAQRTAVTVLGPGIVRAATAAEAVLVDGGTAAGVMSVLGEAVSQQSGDRPILVGVAPAELVDVAGVSEPKRTPLEQNHSHFVLAPGHEWGAETDLMIRLAGTLADGASVVAVMIGGGAVTKLEALAAVREGWPLFIIEGTGGVADRIAALRREHESAQQDRIGRLLRTRGPARASRIDQVDDPDLEDIATADSLRLVHPDDVAELARDLAWELQDEATLKSAWRTFAGYDALAGDARKTFAWFQGTVLLVGIGGTFLALLDDAVGRGGWLGDIVHWTVVATPILVSLLIALAIRIGFGKRWVLLRGAAEAAKSEIYRYRTRTGVYGDTVLAEEGLAREEALATRLNAIDERLMQTEASSWPLTPYAGPLPPRMYGASANDDGLSRLEPDSYLAFRIGDQLSYFHPKVVRLARQLRAFQLVALAAGAVGTLLAAAGFEVWIGLTTAIAAAAVAHIGYTQVEPTLVAYNQAAGVLENLRRHWSAQPAAKRDFDSLVGEAEGVLATELAGWVQQMNQAIEDAVKEGRASSGRVETPNS